MEKITFPVKLNLYEYNPVYRLCMAIIKPQPVSLREKSLGTEFF